MLSFLMPLTRFVSIARDVLTCSGTAVRIGHISEIHEKVDEDLIYEYLADELPFFYRNIEDIVSSLRDGYFRTTIRDTLNKLPKAKSFKESHMGEIISAIFARDVLGLKILYKKLTLLTAENSNAYKMDLVLYRIDGDVVYIIFGEVKMSAKSSVTAGKTHKNSIYPSLFSSIKQYETKDRDFDLAAAKDQIKYLDLPEREIIAEALKPYSGKKKIEYAGFIVIDLLTKDIKDMEMLLTKPSNKEFNVDVICVQNLSDNIINSYEALERMAQ